MYSLIKITCACLILAVSVSACKSEFAPRNETDGGPCRNFTNQNILNILEELRERMEAPLPRFDIPTLEPLYLGELNLNESEFLAGLDTVISNASVVGISGFVVEHLDLNVIGFFIELGIVVPQMDIVGWHVSNGSLYGLVPVVGEGAVNLTVHNLTLAITGRLNHTGEVWEAVDLSMNLTIDALSGGFENLTDEFFNELLNLSGREILELMWPGVQPTVEEAVAGAAAEFLNYFSIEDLMRMLFAGELDWYDAESTTAAPTTVTGFPSTVASMEP